MVSECNKNKWGEFVNTMRVIKVLNNSLVLALDEEGQESILMGKGIGSTNPLGMSFWKVKLKRFLF